jgi:hypothetical protein
MILSFFVSLALLGLSGLLIDSHLRSWRSARERPHLPARDRQFAASQFRRRMFASGLIGAIGIGIGLGQVVPQQPGPMAAYLAALVTACAWIMLLALADFWATRRYYHQLQSDHRAAQLQLAAEMRPADGHVDADA